MTGRGTGSRADREAKPHVKSVNVKWSLLLEEGATRSAGNGGRRTPTGPTGPRPPRAGAWPPPHRDRRPRPRSSPSRETRGFHSWPAAPSSIDHMMQRAWPARRSVRRAWPHPNAQNVRRRCVDGWRSRNVRAVAQAAAASIALSTPICFDPRRNRGRRAKKHNLADVINLNSRFWPFDYVGED